MLSFSHRVSTRAQQTGGWLCVGLDPRIDRLPATVPASPQGLITFCRDIVEATSPFATAFKINFAFFEALGPAGWSTLKAVRDLIATDVPVIADAKRGDIGSTSEAYAHAIFDQLSFDAVTLSPYLGWDALQPFMGYHDRCLFILCRTSNPGSAALQELDTGGRPLYLEVAHQTLAQSSRADLGLVVAATYPAALRAVRSVSPDLVLLVPGVGAQGAKMEETIGLAGNDVGGNALIAVSRDIIYASNGTDYASAAADQAQSYRQQMADALRHR